MSDILDDIIDDVEIEPKKSKLVLKWVLRIAIIIIPLAFAFGQIVVKFLNKTDDVNNTLINHTTEINTIKDDIKHNRENTNLRIDNLNSRVDYLYKKK